MLTSLAVHLRQQPLHKPPLARRVLLVLVLALMQAAPALASAACSQRLHLDLAAARAAQSASTWAREDAVAQRQTDLALAQQGITASIGARPTVGLGNDTDPSDELSTLDIVGYQFDAAVGYRHDEVAIARARAALVTAEAALAAQRRNDVLDALVALSRLRVSERAEAAAAAELEATLAGLERAEGTADERQARLQARRAELAVQDAAAATAAQLDALAGLGVQAPDEHDEACALVPLSEAPSADREDHTGRRALQAALEVAEALHARALWAPVRDLRLEAHYQEGGGRATASVGLAAGRPDANLALRWRPSGKDVWRVQLSANVRLDESLGATVVRAEANSSAARAELAAFGAAQLTRETATRIALERAAVELELLDEALQLAVIKRDDPTEARNLVRNTQAVARALDTRERGIQAYYRAYAAHLGARDAQWPAD